MTSTKYQNIIKEADRLFMTSPTSFTVLFVVLNNGYHPIVVGVFSSYDKAKEYMRRIIVNQTTDTYREITLDDGGGYKTFDDEITVDGYIACANEIADNYNIVIIDHLDITLPIYLDTNNRQGESFGSITEYLSNIAPPQGNKNGLVKTITLDPPLPDLQYVV